MRRDDNGIWSSILRGIPLLEDEDGKFSFLTGKQTGKILPQRVNGDEETFLIPVSRETH